jgi:NADPH-dependent 2,4-dienoyl-CoA reductase/sulfur reductase-like enzyme
VQAAAEISKHVCVAILVIAVSKAIGMASRGLPDCSLQVAAVSLQGNLTGRNQHKEGLTMSYKKPIGHIAVVGAGVIGASWAAEYLARGFDVVATDPAPNAESNLRKYIDQAWTDLVHVV